jgi:SpoVK/Ycf46/Vps4 family AAA+-type ATPase
MADMPLEVDQYMKAGFSGIWIRSNEHEDAVQDLINMCTKNEWEIAHWDMDKGLLGSKKINDQRTPEEAQADPVWYNKKPYKLIAEMGTLAANTKAVRTLFILKNFHRKDFLDNSTILQAVQNSMAQGKTADHPWCICILSPFMDIPVEWDADFVAVDHALPTREQLWTIAEELAEDGELPTKPADKMLLLEAASGLTRRGAEGAYSLSIVKKKPFDPSVVWDLKAQALKKKGLLTLYEGDASFEAMGGLDQFKDFTSRLLEKKTDNPLLFPKGLLLLGIPGSGKSQAVKCLGNSTGRRVLSLDIGALRSKWQGETDANIREALATADAMQPCILFIDEIEKALSGVQSSGATDGGTGSRLFGKLLEWLNDHETDVFFVGTCNDIGQLMGSNPEFARAERFDGIFFFDLPTVEERKAIWRIYIKMYDITQKISESEILQLSDQWTGAEIKTCCRLSAMMEMKLEEAAEHVVPIVRTAEERLTALRGWAEGKCLSATRKGLFRIKDAEKAAVLEPKKKKPSRKVSRPRQPA